MSVVGRRTAAVAASSGLLVSMIGTAAPASAATFDAAKLNGADLTALTAQARAVLEAAPVVTVDDDAKFNVADVDTGTVQVTPAPEVVKPQPRHQAPSRTQARSTSRATTTRSTAPVPVSAVGSRVISIAARYQGVPYVYGGSTPSGFDCSGFVSYVYAQVGISLPHSSSAIGSMGTRIPRSQARPGDIIWTPGHVSLYAGGNQQIDASRPGTTIQFRKIWQSNPTFIRMG